MNDTTAEALPPGAHDFDFLHGAWDVRHRRLRTRLAGSSDWAEFGGTMRAEPILGGLGNFDQNEIDLPEGRYQASTLRLFEIRRSVWSLHWVDGRDPKLDPPLVGQFADGVGQFFGHDIFEGRPIRIRFLWSDITPRSARWEQAFSPDAGASWETNWIMEFVRR
jgi:hypothetical protein